jgi:hypothetical protein
MKDIAQQLRAIITATEPKLLRMQDENVKFKPAASEWSKKEILGHLIDSAANNHQRFVRAAENRAAGFPTYDQEQWVRIQRYNEASWSLLVTLWSTYNTHLSRVIECIPQGAESSPCNVGEENPVSLDFVVKDYLRHLRLHLTDILEDAL